MVEVLIQLGFFLTLTLVGLFAGTFNERKHYRSIVQREQALAHIKIFNEKRTPLELSGQPFYLVQGSVVISGDYFKIIAASLKSFFGGSLTSFESLLDRGRREAILRMKEQAQELGADIIFAVRLETSVLHGQDNDRASRVACAEVLAYGTAWKSPSSAAAAHPAEPAAPAVARDLNAAQPTAA